MQIGIPTIAAALTVALATGSNAEGLRIAGGVVEVEGLGAALNGTFHSGSAYGFSGTQAAVYGSSRLGIELTPDFSGQLDGWINYASYNESWPDFDPPADIYTPLTVGALGHLTWHAGKGAFLGVAGGLGNENGDG